MKRRYALVVIVEAPDADAAWGNVNTQLGDNEATCYIGDACSVGPADYYETNQIGLLADGELAVAAPNHVLEARRREHEREVDRLEGEGRR